mmetsp:Transcript_9302/g.18792  ORF Transcript_9302/g.18792 Transcript_9302/m.18792 type:complete len:410 (+) Transcript_9302:94-1323(+)|eukprot:CAMPEP_0119061474 /NCGR_PEP_ID=MMETSP1178-20130426/5254_1 /TAXON_ID=33656 /ORGANISM="unid sp, Strain CCMP2000" /LENGTH=409 /DNA_ID=CAMNT_0007042681 /DNA_START=94 /DNA_END=1323 /DNA_ORIENTATION=+
MDKFGQTSGHSGRQQTNFQTPPESQAELPVTPRSSSSCWTKREHTGDAGAPCKAQRTSVNPISPTVVLDDVQRKVLEELVMCVDSQASVVITNPRAKDNPIVYVTEPWQTMCGFTYAEANGQNPRIVQGERTDRKVVRAISGALANQSACKVQFVNYRRGSMDQPFWNMLSISPVLYQGNVVFYMANLQDYSYHIGQMVSLTPSQFCRAATHFQRGRRLQKPDTLVPSKPAIYEIDLEFPLPSCQGKSTAVAATPQPIKRLGWNGLVLEPEHLSERLKDALQTIGASYELHICGDQEGEIFVLHAKIDAVACRVTVSEDPVGGSQRISVTRLAGDTFEYHKAFRQLREHLGEACTLTRPVIAQGSDAVPPTRALLGAPPRDVRPAGGGGAGLSVDESVLPLAPCAEGAS